MAARISDQFGTDGRSMFPSQSEKYLSALAEKATGVCRAGSAGVEKAAAKEAASKGVLISPRVGWTRPYSQWRWGTEEDGKPRAEMIAPDGELIAVIRHGGSLPEFSVCARFRGDGLTDPS